MVLTINPLFADTAPNILRVSTFRTQKTTQHQKDHEELPLRDVSESVSLVMFQNHVRLPFRTQTCEEFYRIPFLCERRKWTSRRFLWNGFF
jgi:hypothetical protein